MKKVRYPAEFEAEAVKQVTERGHGVVDVAKRLGMSDKKAELKRANEERDILKKPQRTLPSRQGEVRLHGRAPRPVPAQQHVPRSACTAQWLLRLEGQPKVQASLLMLSCWPASGNPLTTATAFMAVHASIGTYVKMGWRAAKSVWHA